MVSFRAEEGTLRIIEISCLDAWRQISDYLDNEVSPEMRARLEAHFKICEHCSAIVDGTRNVVQLVGDGVIFDLPHGFGDRLKQRLNDEFKK